MKRRIPPISAAARRALLIPAGWAVVLLLSAGASAVPNGDFGTIPNRSWLTDGPGATRGAVGDRPAVVLGSVGNHYGHVGDADAVGADGENPSRIFQWFAATDSAATGPDCVVSFRFRSLLLPGEMAWVRVKSETGERVSAIPNSNNRWASIRPSVILPGGCGADSVLVEFGMRGPGGDTIGGRLNVDEVAHRCVTAEVDVEEDDRDVLPPAPDRRRAVPVRHTDPAKRSPRTDLNPYVGVLVIAGIGWLVWRVRTGG